MESISIVGPGRVGGALAIALSRLGYRIENLVCRTPRDLSRIVDAVTSKPTVISIDAVKNLSSDVIFITTADSEISAVSASLAAKIGPQSIIFHTSGSRSSDDLASIAERGNATGSLHPLVAISDPILGAESFSGSYFCVEGHARAVEIAGTIVSRLGGKSFAIDTARKSLYHAGAVMAAGHLVSLVDASIGVFEACGIATDHAKEILLPLVESTVKNLRGQDPAEALTGPFARADLSTVARHLQAFDSSSLDREKHIYIEISFQALKLAAEGGADSVELDEIRKTILMAKASAK